MLNLRGVTPAAGEKTAKSLSEQLTASRIAALIAVFALIYGIASMHRYGVTSDAPALYYAGDRTLYWMAHPTEPGALDFRGNDPSAFTSTFDRHQAAYDDPIWFPVFPALVCAITSRVFHDSLGWMNVIDGHHLGLLLLHCVGLFFFGIYTSRLFGRVGGLAATIALALFPSSIGHSFNNPKDWPCAVFYGLAMLAACVGIVEQRARHLIASAVFVGLSISAKFNGYLVFANLVLWVPIAWWLLYRKKIQISAAMSSAFIAMPYLAFGLFIVLWPWIWHAGIAQGWDNFAEHIRFMISRGVGERPTWTSYPFRVLLLMSPPIVLFLALSGTAIGWRGDARQRAIWILLLIWLLFPLVRIAAPHSNFYDANRHFLEYVPALCALAGFGVARLTELVRSFCADRERVANYLGVGAAVIGLASLVYADATYRPFEAAYFNIFAGGLHGAQRDRPLSMEEPHVGWANGTEGDFWWSSVRDAVTFLQARHVTNAVGLCQTGKVLWGDSWPEGVPMPNFVDARDPDFNQTAWVYIMPRQTSCPWPMVQRLESERPIVHRVERDGGLIFEILGARDGHPHQPRPSTVENAERFSR
ncbi:MAG: glycosyltransferase family 39 protein [Sandaracinaceae bacterium]|nr:glycosyltransferase family 39 protein [Sandaracinaceae bacterium]